MKDILSGYCRESLWVIRSLFSLDMSQSAFILSSFMVTVACLSHDEAVVPLFPVRAAVDEKSAVVHLPPLVCVWATQYTCSLVPHHWRHLSLCPSRNSVPEMLPHHTSWKDSLKYMFLSVKKVTPPTSCVEKEIQGNGLRCPGTWRNWGWHFNLHEIYFQCNDTEVSGHWERQLGLPVPLFPTWDNAEKCGRVPTHPPISAKGKTFNGLDGVGPEWGCVLAGRHTRVSPQPGAKPRGGGTLLLLASSFGDLVTSSPNPLSSYGTLENWFFCFPLK